jgi:O-antigen ligase
MAVIERPDVPKSIFGIPGLNPWNIAFISIFLAFLADKSKTKINITPQSTKFLIAAYLFCIFYSFIIMISDYSMINEFSKYVGAETVSLKGLLIDDIINPLKYFVLAFMVYSGCDSHERYKWSIISIAILNILLAIQVIKWMPITELADGASLEQRAVRVLDREIGYYRSDLAVLLAGASWAVYSLRALYQSRIIKLIILGSAMACALAVALTGGRIGMVAWLVVALLVALFKYRKFILIGPIIVLLIVSNIPAVYERFTQGVGEGEDAVNISSVDQSSMTSGRSEIWPHVIQEIADNALFGAGRRGMQNSGLSLNLGYEYGLPFPHPHNAYLEFMLDNGILLSLLVFLLFFRFVKYSASHFLVSQDKLTNVVGGFAFSFLVAHMIGSLGSQTFYPRQSFVSIMCVCALVLRLYLEDLKGIDDSHKIKKSGSKRVNYYEGFDLGKSPN